MKKNILNIIAVTALLVSFSGSLAAQNQPPIITISSPSNGSSFSAPATITITANASDPDGNIVRVEFFNGATKIAEVPTAPYAFVWNNVVLGTYSLTAVATDNLNAVTTSSAVSIIVNDGTPIYISSVVENATPLIVGMNYSTSLANIIPALSAFTVQVNAVIRTINSVTITGTKVQLNLSSQIQFGDAITVSYTKPVTNPLQTPSGGQAASLASKSVTNNVSAGIVIPTVTSSGATAIASISANSGGNVTSDGGANVRARGVCWNTSSNPTISNNHTSDGSGTGSFTSLMTGLVPNTIYFIRAYATNSAGTAYGINVSFTTYKSDAITDLDGNYYNTLTIGSQVWMGENLKVSKFNDNKPINFASDVTQWVNISNSTTSGYCWYADNPANEDPYGALYNWYAASTGNLCPIGWNVPSNAEWTTLTTFLGGESVAGGKLKETGTAHWTYFISGGATNETGFTALPGGGRDRLGNSTSMGNFGSWWSTTEATDIPGDAYTLMLSYAGAYANLGRRDMKAGFSVRCIKSAAIAPTVSTTPASNISLNTATSGGNITSDGGSSVTARGLCWNTSPNPTTANDTTWNGRGTGSFISIITGLAPGTTYHLRAYATNSEGTGYGNEISFTTYKSDAFTDIDSNYYNTLTIGSQVWMGENLKTTRYNDGSNIPNVIDNVIWDVLTSPAYAWYGNNIVNKQVYGALYNWYAVETGKLCPVGWQVPTDAQLTRLTNYVGGESVAGGKLKEIGTTHWNSPNEGATDEYGFTAFPGGARLLNGVFYSIGDLGSWWSSIDTLSTYAWHRFVWNNNIRFSRIYDSKTDGFSVRCLKDNIGPTIVTNANDNGVGSLRYALEYANSNVGVKDTITFNIPGTGPFTIQPLSSLPSITDPAVIDGYTQPGASASKSILLIELNGTNAGSGSNGLTINANASNCTVKGLVINRFPASGILIYSNGNIIEGNYLGTNINGTTDLGNGGSGIFVQTGAKENKIGGITLAERNIISGNTGGIFLIDNRGASVKGNYIGVDVTGKKPLGNETYGLDISGGRENIIGGSNSSERNVISSNKGNGIFIEHGSSSNTIKGNYIGTDAAGNLPFGNTGAGIMISSASYTMIGGANPGEGNVISGNGVAGISINSSNLNTIMGNYLGTDLNGVDSIGNFVGIIIYGSATANQIGDTINWLGQHPPVKGAGNIIAFSKEQGIVVVDDAVTKNIILSNSIHSNGGLGIDLGGAGVTPTDSIYNEALGIYDYDDDDGPNNLQNYPVLTSFKLDLGSKTVFISGYLESTKNKNFTLQFFASKVADNTGYGEGQKYLGSAKVKTGENGKALFDTTFSISSSWGDVITATATDPAGNTSEFSMAIGGIKDQIIASNKWPFPFKVNEVGVPRITDNSDITAVRESFNTWENISTAKIDFVDAGTTPTKWASATDGINLVSFVDDKFPFPPRVLAIAAKTLKIGANDTVAQIIDADILVNPQFVLHDVGVGYKNSNKGYYDVQSIITHEIGHVMGLLHSGIVNSTMFFMLDSGISVRSLEQDDRSWASYKYPKIPDYGTAFGSISGKIIYGYGGAPVAGALVLAINTAANTTAVHAYSDAEGNYLVPGLPPGSYNIYIQPIDGDVYGYALRPGNISSYLYCNTIYTDFPNEYYSPDELLDNTPPGSDIIAVINVSAGQNRGHIDLITNKDLTPPTLKSVRPTDPVEKKIKVLSNFIIRFSEPVDETTLTNETCYLELGTPDNKKFVGTFTTLPDSVNIVIFNPDSVLRFSRTYTLHLTTGINDLKRNALIAPSPVNFTTVDRDRVPPTITGTFPVNHADSVFVTTRINVFFSEPMNSESVTDNFALSWDEGTPAVTNKVDGSISWDNEYKNLTFTPSKSLNENKDYKITVSTGATDLSKNHLKIVTSIDTSCVFYTVIDAAPEIIYLGPRANQPDVTIETPVVVDFSEPIEPASVDATTFILKSVADQITINGSFEFLNANSRVVFRPETNLEYNKAYSVKLTTGIKDVSETVRHLAADRISAFTTASKPVSPQILYIDPSRGVLGSAVAISGTGFDPDPAKNLISFNGIVTYPKTASLNTLITEVPMGTLSGPVTVTVNNKVSDQMQFYVIPEYMNDPSYVVSSKSTGSPTGGVAISGTGEAVFAMVTNPDGGTVTRVGLGSQAGSIISIPVGTYPLKVDIDQLGKMAYVTNFNSHDVSVIDLNTNKVIKTISVGIEPYGVVVTPDGKRVYVSNYFSGNLSLIDVDPTSGGFDHVVANVPTGTNSGNVAVTADAGMVLVTGDFGLKIVDSDPKSNDYNSVIATVSSGTKTGDVTVTADAGFAIVSTLEGSLLIINLHPVNDDYTGAVVASVPTGTNVSDVKASGDAVYVYVTDTENDQILVYKIGKGGSASPSGSSTGSITLIPQDPISQGIGDAPRGLAISAAGDKIYVVTGNPANTIERRVTTISLTGGLISPSVSIEDLIITIQNMINAGKITKLRGYALMVTLNAALKNIYNGRPKLAILDLTAFNALVKTYIKNKQINTAQGNALINSATAIINQLKGVKSGEEETYFTDSETQPDQDIVTQTKLGVIYPNPTREAITINYEIAADEMNEGRVTINIYDISGKLVGNLVNRTQESGRYSATWSGNYDNGTHVPYGIYFIRFKAGKAEEVREIMLVK